jgi:heat-inducible transcriptional repressor
MHELDERSKKILWAIIKSYTVYNGPIGSRTVMKRYPMGLSSATIRNTMADLEELGYVTQPHTSAGRIPTERGYRFYVDTIIKEHDYSINKKILQQLADRLRIIEKDVNKLVNEASKTLSKFSHYLGIASAPKTELITLEHIKFIKHKRDNILCVLVSEEGIVKNKIITFKERSFSQGELDKIANYLNSELKGLTLKEIKTEILSRISREKTVCDKLISNALILCNKIMEWETENIFYYGGIAGTPNLPDFATLKQIKKLFKAIEEKHLMVKLLDKLSESEGVKVFIGSENILSEMKELSFVASTYNDGRRTLGTIGVIGPTRMNYGKVIPIVSHTAKTLTQILSKR